MIVKLNNKQGVEITCKTLDTKEEKSNYFKGLKEIGRSPLPFIYNYNGKNIVVYEIIEKQEDKEKVIDFSNIKLVIDESQLINIDESSTISSLLQGKEKFVYEISHEVHGLFQYCDNCKDETQHKTHIKKAICCMCGYSYELN